MGYRWAILAAGVFAQMSLSAIQQGLPALGPELRDELHLSLGQVGVVLASVLPPPITITLLGWGWLAAPVGGRLVAAQAAGKRGITAPARRRRGRVGPRR